MKRLLSLVPLLAAFALSTNPAFASPLISGSISFTGTSTETPTELDFPANLHGSSEQSILSTGTGDLTEFVMGDTANFNNAFSFAAVPGESLFIVNEPGEQLRYDVSSVECDAVSGICDFGGTLSIFQRPLMAPIVTLGANTANAVYTPGANDTFTLTVTTTPEPSSLMLLGTGLVSSAGMLFRRRRMAA